MNRALCKALYNPQSSCQGLGFGRLHVIAEGRSPSKQDCGGFQSCSQFVPSSGRKFNSTFSESLEAEKNGVQSASSPSPLPLPLSLSVAAFSSSLKFFRFARDENPRKSSQVLRSVGFQEYGDANRVFLEGPRSSPQELGDRMRTLKSVDMSNLESLAAADSGGSEGVDTRAESAEHVSKPLMRNFVKLRSFWKKENSDREASESSRTKTTTDSVESCQFLPMSCGCQSCGACRSDGQPGFDAASMPVTPHSEIARDKEYFAKFLCRVPSSERKRITQMAHLSNLAYRIPTIEEDTLLRHHHFRVVTSSLELKALAPAAGDAKESATEVEERIGTEESALDLEEAEGIREATMASLNPAAGYAMAATAASCNAQACDILLSKSETNASGFGEEIRGDCRHGKDLEKCDSASRAVGEDVTVDSNSSPKNSWYARTASALLRGAPGGSAEPETEQSTAHPPQGCPCEWFACENEVTNTLVIAIQGTESLAAWQANLRFEPTQFEPESDSGVMVHRGIYEAAKRLYEEVLPCIRSHLEAHKENARLQFTGHSLGGSLAVLLSLMVGVRNAAPVSALLPVYTFGSPCIMCGGNHLLAQLGLPHSHIRSIVMHMDIVPRTFACDYPDHVAGVLKRVSGTFRNHTCLLQQRLIYAPMGEMVIMQPEADQAPGHPLLPPGSGLYSLRNPSQVGISQAQDENPLRWARELQSAERAFLNVPHPLEILSDRNAYGSEGTVSRDHDCRNYYKALQRMRRNELRQRRRVLRELNRRQLWAPLLENGDAAPLSNFLYGEPEQYACAMDTQQQPLGLKGPDDLKSVGKLSRFFHFGHKMTGPSSKNDPAPRP